MNWLRQRSSSELSFAIEDHDVELRRSAGKHVGHIHASAGITCLNGTTYVNASMVNRRYEIAHQPIELNV